MDVKINYTGDGGAGQAPSVQAIKCDEYYFASVVPKNVQQKIKIELPTEAANRLFQVTKATFDITKEGTVEATLHVK